MTSAPDLVLVNGKVGTGDARRPWVTGMAVGEGVVVALAAAAEMVKLVGVGTQVLDVKGEEIVLPPGVGIGSRVEVIVGEDGRVSIIAV